MMNSQKIIQSLLYKVDGQPLQGGRQLLRFILWHQDKLLQTEALRWLEGELKKVVIYSWSQQRKQLAIDQLLALLPYLLRDKDMISIPTWEDGQYTLKQYHCEAIPMLPKWWLKTDQYYAFGMTCQSASPILLFKGTTYPTDQGFWTTVMADLFPFGNIGSIIMTLGHHAIQNWANDKQYIKAVGQSLGGALAIYSGKINGVEAITATNPALPSFQLSNDVDTTVIVNSGDIISRIGLMSKHWGVWSVSNSKVTSKFFAHIQPWICQESILDPIKKAPSPPPMWSLLYWVIRPVAFFLLLPIYLMHVIYQVIKSSAR